MTGLNINIIINTCTPLFIYKRVAFRKTIIFSVVYVPSLLCLKLFYCFQCLNNLPLLLGVCMNNISLPEI